MAGWRSPRRHTTPCCPVAQQAGGGHPFRFRAGCRRDGPPEAVRSSAIVPLLEQHFEIVAFKPLGGNILQFLLAGIAGNFRTPEGERLLAMLFSIEDALLAAGELESDFAYIVGRVR